MKILQINTFCGIASTGRIATDLHQILLNKGYQSCIAYGRDEPRNCDNTIKIGNKMNTYVDGIKSRLLDNQGFNSSIVTKKFINIMKSDFK
ncbi:hypothetical protein AN644_03540 [Candidatus Epulonipiscium fishelsonii]|nr:hypothetical protein AN644_03540 [Epulopiscium sp. SCG-C06WGA-EpuloA1]